MRMGDQGAMPLVSPDKNIILSNKLNRAKLVNGISGKGLQDIPQSIFPLVNNSQLPQD